MSRPVWAWAGGRARGRVGSLVPCLSGLAVAAVLCGVCPAVASARAHRRSLAAGQSVHRSHHPAGAVRARGVVLGIGSGEGTRGGSLAVRRLQRGLRRAGYAPGPVDGRYGPLTAAAVARFQANHHLPVTGMVDRATRRAMRARPVLRLGAGLESAHGSAVVALLQRRLRRAGFSPGVIDGRLGPRTERAIIAFQHARHLAVTGIAGAAVQRALLSTPHQPSAPKGGQATRPTHKAPARHAPASRPHPHSPFAPVAPSLPVLWIVLALGLIGATAILAGYRRTRRRMRTDPPARPRRLGQTAKGRRR